MFIAEKTGLGRRFALEFRNKELLGNDDSCAELMKKVTLVSVDSPDYRDRIFPEKIIYTRMHGRAGWYSYNYSQEEIRKTIGKISEFKPAKIFIYFNNDHNMLENARMTLKALSGL